MNGAAPGFSDPKFEDRAGVWEVEGSSESDPCPAELDSAVFGIFVDCSVSRTDPLAEPAEHEGAIGE